MSRNPRSKSAAATAWPRASSFLLPGSTGTRSPKFAKRLEAASGRPDDRSHVSIVLVERQPRGAGRNQDRRVAQVVHADAEQTNRAPASFGLVEQRDRA